MCCDRIITSGDPASPITLLDPLQFEKPNTVRHSRHKFTLTDSQEAQQILQRP